MTNATWMKDLPAYTDKGVAHEVAGKTLTFYPASADMIFMLRGIAQPLARGITTLMGGSKGEDQGWQQRSFDLPDGEGGRGTETTTDAITTDLAKLRSLQREQAVDSVMNAFTSEDTKGVLGCLIVDSLRPRDQEASPDLAFAMSWMATVDLPTLGQYLHGLFQANKEVLGPLVEQVSEVKGQLGSKITEALARELDTAPEPTSESQTESSDAADKPTPTPDPGTPIVSA